MNDRIRLYPGCRSGESLYSGTPCPDVLAYKYLKFEGLFQIHYQIQQAIEHNKRYNGVKEVEDYGLDDSLLFVDIYSGRKFLVRDQRSEFFEDTLYNLQCDPEEPQFPQVLDEEDFYIIRSTGYLIEPRKNANQEQFKKRVLKALNLPF